MILSLFSAKHGYLDEIETENISKFEKFMHRYFHENFQDLVNEVEEKQIIEDDLDAKLNDAMAKTVEQFKLIKGV